ncbi:hypothetical protein [Moraxella equi]|uniref:Uncharacterized protein n=1 Tax=Moraxella equi TaxID=60442 RepID=A0A378QNK4_9GAMM|nr:hypothetical protein [Moraxella equi]OPH36300.1 hypothetical protein B5J93_09585 [Moraxella equi]STZ02030.1 Uncharacterised protein [Moraxella equi]
MAYEFLSLQGKANLARLIDGKATALTELGNLTALNIGISTETTKIKESKTGKRQDVLEIEKGKGVTVEMTMNEQTKNDVALAFQAEVTELEGRTVSDTPLATLKVGDKVKLDGFNLSEVSLKDDNSKPLEKGKHYTLDEKFGVLTVLSLDDIAQPVKATFTEGAMKSSVIFSLPANAEYYFLFEGVNSIDNKKMAVELWRFKPSANGNMGFINEELGELQINGSCLADTKKQEDAKLGGLGRIVYLD